jgi:hypothetical protein
MAGTSAQAGEQGCQRADDGKLLANWKRIFEQEERGGERAGYGERIVEQLARDLSARFGRGFSRSNVFQMRQFYLACRARVQTPSGQFDLPFPLSWPHYVRLLTVADDAARDYYEHEALRRLVSTGSGSPDRNQGVSTVARKTRHVDRFILARRTES